MRLVLVNVRKASKKIYGLSGHFCRATYVYKYGLLSGDLKSGLLCHPIILVVGLLFLLLKIPQIQQFALGFPHGEYNALP